MGLGVIKENLADDLVTRLNFRRALLSFVRKQLNVGIVALADIPSLVKVDGELSEQLPLILVPSFI